MCVLVDALKSQDTISGVQNLKKKLTVVSKTVVKREFWPLELSFWTQIKAKLFYKI